MAIEDVFYAVIALFSVAVFLLFMVFLMGQFDSTMTQKFNNVSAGSGLPISQVSTIFNTSLDYVFIAIFFGFFFALVITGFMTQVHPIFLPIFIFLLAFGVIIVAPMLSNVYETISSTDALSASAVNTPMMNWIMDKLPLVMTIIGAVLIIALYSKTFMGGGNASTP